ncbi:hypothetical protein [Fischerella sp.]|jgi:predicted transposase/invertase (TIGR01784 family)|uniref:hypothetical protein n=1 Tax=Fischerella sp. TaxID=1191 RepID=UPI0025B8963D|nr:hypothetical protein [Fischerella sp.]
MDFSWCLSVLVVKKEWQEGKLEAIPRLLALGLTVEQIAEALGLEIEQVRQAAQNQSSN